VPNRQLVIATGVSSGWRRFIFESPTLRKKLFLKPSGRPAQYCRLFMDEPQLSEYFPTGYLYMDAEVIDVAKEDRDEAATIAGDEEAIMIYGIEPPVRKRFKIVAECPMMEPEIPSDQPSWERKVRGITGVRHTGEEWLLRRGWLGHEDANLRKRASYSGPWRQMYLTAPPVDRVVIDFEWKGYNVDGVFKNVEGSRAITNTNGITVEDLISGFWDLE